MKRLLAAIRWDFRLQYRQGFYYAAIFVAVFMVLILLQLPDQLTLQHLMYQIV